MLALVLSAGLALRTTLDGHEVLVAETARQMAEGKSWIVPTFNGENRLNKPPLDYWLTAIIYRLTGRIDELTARLPSAIASVTGVKLKLAKELVIAVCCVPLGV